MPFYDMSDGAKYFESQRHSEIVEEIEAINSWINIQMDLQVERIWHEQLKFYKGRKTTPAMEAAIKAMEEAVKLIKLK